MPGPPRVAHAQFLASPRDSSRLRLAGRASSASRRERDKDKEKEKDGAAASTTSSTVAAEAPTAPKQKEEKRERGPRGGGVPTGILQRDAAPPKILARPAQGQTTSEGWRSRTVGAPRINRRMYLLRSAPPRPVLAAHHPGMDETRHLPRASGLALRWTALAGRDRHDVDAPDTIRLDCEAGVMYCRMSSQSKCAFIPNFEGHSYGCRNGGAATRRRHRRTH
ncbi:hypothetical protein BD309DRAFT_87100 [Dichomitus squalens]|nr:hypothetical protein BD309DRAFT_87100 [Dichomitus squalens]